ncbi:MAG: hypothetical protein H6740_04110 [Alphaproteobacteria bacterium]|nr:hypothetical protein [Alphaproteobacteria bacterium]
MITGLEQFGLYIVGQVPPGAVEEERAAVEACEVLLEQARVEELEVVAEEAAAEEAWSDELDEAVEERAALMEHEGGLPRAEAEYLARRELALGSGLSWVDPLFPEERYDLDGFAVHAPPGAQEKVEAVAPVALALGWTEPQLFSTRGRLRFPSPDYGLVCYLEPGARVVEVNACWVGLEGLDGAHTRFFNRARPQVWHRAHPARAGPRASL